MSTAEPASSTTSAVTFVLRPAARHDVAAIAAIEARSFGDAWPARAFYSMIDGDAVHFTVAVTGEGDAAGVLGYSIVVRAADEAELANLAVAPEARRLGVGGALVRALLRDAGTAGVQAVYLEVRESNLAARALYARHGFEPVGRRRRYYQHPEEDALVLRWAAAGGSALRSSDDAPVGPGR